MLLVNIRRSIEKAEDQSCCTASGLKEKNRLYDEYDCEMCSQTYSIDR